MTMIRRLQALHYQWGDSVHGQIPKRYVEFPQIGTQAKQLSHRDSLQSDDFVAVRQDFTWTVARSPYKPGSCWEQWLVFPDGVRWFLAYDKVTSTHTVDTLILRIDMPGHIKTQQRADTFPAGLSELSRPHSLAELFLTTFLPIHASCIRGMMTTCRSGSFEFTSCVMVFGWQG